MANLESKLLVFLQLIVLIFVVVAFNSVAFFSSGILLKNPGLAQSLASCSGSTRKGLSLFYFVASCLIRICMGEQGKDLLSMLHMCFSRLDEIFWSEHQPF